MHGVLAMRTLWERVPLLASAALVAGGLLLACPRTAGVAEAGSPVGDPNANQTCQVCHATPGLNMQLPNGETIPASVDPQVFVRSVHGTVLQCTACHADIAGYPHAGRDLARPAARDVPFLMRAYASCGECHRAEYDQYLGSTHAQALNAGKGDSAVCSDCHGAHDTGAAHPSDVGLALGPAVYNCASCHPLEFDEYKQSVHGRDLLEKGDVNVPSCVDCHGVHDIHQAKDSNDFRSQSLAMCSSCHANAALMRQYGLSPDILTTYVADFHGTTAQLYPARSGDAPEQAMCYDCHTVHNIQSTVGSNGLAVQANMLQACQKCHPQANTNFPAAWLGHYQPTPDHSALVFWIRGIYNVLISATVLILVGHIALDIGRVLLNTLRRGTHGLE